VKPVYNNTLKLFFVLFLCIIDNVYSQSNLLVNESLNGSFSQGKMEGSINKFFTQDTYYLRSDFNVKILRLFNIKRDEGYIISFSDSTVTKINHKKKRFAVYSFSEFLEENKNNPQDGPPQDDNKAENESNSDEEDLTINISEKVEILNGFKTRKAKVIVNAEEESDLFIWFSEATLKSKTELTINKKLKEMFDGSIPPNLGMNAMEIPYDEYDINTNALTIKFEAVSENGTFTYNLLGYSEQDLLPEIFKVSEKYRKVKKL
jgi:hypothetical protein|tara:strand:- start:436 stop:1221 length:786 start_codon:yes stop_codon:yes gene_type:complete